MWIKDPGTRHEAKRSFVRGSDRDMALARKSRLGSDIAVTTRLDNFEPEGVTRTATVSGRRRSRCVHYVSTMLQWVLWILDSRQSKALPNPGH